MDFLNTIFATIIALGVLVTVHEWGHFIVARLCGVKVLTFSVGFGKQLFGRSDKQGTRFVLSAIPLGGYVKMLDEREGPVLPELKHQAFNNKHVLQRIAIVVAGPAVNLIFAAIVYSLVFVSGVSVVKPVIGGLTPNTPAAYAQLPVNSEIIAVNGNNVSSWGDVNTELARFIGDTGRLELSTQALNGFTTQEHVIDLDAWNVDVENESPVTALGLQVWQPEVPAIIGQLVEGGQAEKAGFMVGDQLLAIDGEYLDDWMAFVQRIQKSPQQRIDVLVRRDGTSVTVSVTPAKREVTTSEGVVDVGYIGAGVQAFEWPENMKRDIQFGVVDALVQGVEKTYTTAVLILDSIWKMLEGVISVKNLSGPITIAKVAGDSAESGLISFLTFMAYLSISLGVLNLLPIPMLDGGHLVFYVYEWVTGKPLSDTIQAGFQRVGMAVLFSLMGLAMFNDILRL